MHIVLQSFKHFFSLSLKPLAMSSCITANETSVKELDFMFKTTPAQRSIFIFQLTAGIEEMVLNVITTMSYKSQQLVFSST